MKYQGQRNLAGSSPWGPQSQTRLSDGTTINHAYMYEYLEWKQRMQKCELRKQMSSQMIKLFLSLRGIYYVPGTEFTWG